MLITPAVHAAVNLLRRIDAAQSIETAELGSANMAAATALVAEGLVMVAASRVTSRGWSNLLVPTAAGHKVAASFN